MKLEKDAIESPNSTTLHYTIHSTDDCPYPILHNSILPYSILNYTLSFTTSNNQIAKSYPLWHESKVCNTSFGKLPRVDWPHCFSLLPLDIFQQHPLPVPRS